MNTTIESLQALYVKNGGKLTDTYSDICGGDAVGNYTTIPDMVAACAKLNIGGGGGGAEKFVVTLTEENDTWTADKTVAEIVAAYEAKQVVVAQYVADGFTVELPINAGISMQDVAVAIFIGFENAGEDNKNVTVVCANEGSGENIQVTKNLIPTSSNAPLIVTLTADQSTGNFVGNKTYKEVYDAFTAGAAVILSASVGSSAFKLAVQYASYDGTDYEFAFIDSSAVKNTVSGGANDYVTASLA